MDKETFNALTKEFSEVKERVDNLRIFINGQVQNKTIDELNLDLLISQLKAMETYLSILSIRIGYNAPSENGEENNIH